MASVTVGWVPSPVRLWVCPSRTETRSGPAGTQVDRVVEAERALTRCLDEVTSEDEEVARASTERRWSLLKKDKLVAVKVRMCRRSCPTLVVG